MTQLSHIRSLAAAGRIDDARATLARLSVDRYDAHDSHLELANCALELGMSSLALKELNLVLRDAPDHKYALRELAELHRERGEHGKELRYRRRLETVADDQANELRLKELTTPLSEGDHDPREPSEGVSQPAPLEAPDDAALVRFLHMVSGRENVHARMWYDERRGTGYSPVRQPLTPTLLRAHVEGSHTLGVYPVRIDGTVTFFAFDIDVTRAAIDKARGDRDETRRLRRLIREVSSGLAERLTALDLPFVIIDSGYKGRHFWFFLAEPLPADLVRRFAIALANTVWERQRDLSVEVFPKQSQVSRDTLGNLIKLPLGVHLRSKRRAWILSEEGVRAADPWALLREIPRLSRDELLDRMSGLRHDVPPDALEPSEGDEGDVLPAPAPLPDAPAWTAADFDTHPEVGTLIERCPVLAALIDRGLEQRRLGHDEQVVLRHTLGHVPGAVPAVNYVFERCPEVAPSMMLQSPLRGNPISCPKIRKKIPDVTSSVPCYCEFTVATDHYPTPTLHLEEARARGELPEPPPKRDATEERVAEDVARTYAHLTEKRDRIERELCQVRSRFVEVLERLTGRRLDTAEGVWRLDDEDGLPVIEWEPKTHGEEE